MTIDKAMSQARGLLGDKSVSASLDAKWILLDVIEADDSSFLLAHGDEELSPTHEHRYFGLVERRVKGEPLAYILGWWEFFGHRFKITPDVLVPRPATERLVEKALAKIESMNKSLGRTVTVTEIGTGSGCVAITLLLEGDTARAGRSQKEPVIKEIMATDVSAEALMVAQENVRHYGVEGRISLVKEDILETLRNPKIDLIVSNPPYVPSAEVDNASLSPTTETVGLGFEPRVALDGGSDGLDLVREIQKSGLPFIIETVGGNIIEG